MPRRRAEHDGGVAGIERLVHELDRFVENQVIHLLAARIDRLELPRELGCFLRVLGEEQPQTVVRVADAARGVETGREDEPHVRPAQRLAAEPRRLDQGTQPDPAGVGQLLEPVAHQDAVLAHERHDIGDRRERDVVEEMQRQVGRQAKHLDKRLRELERDAGAAQVLVLRFAVGAARVDHGVRGGQLVARQVVIGDDDIYSCTPCRPHRIHRCDPAVTGDDQACSDAPSFCQACRAEVVAVADTIGHEGKHGCAGAAQNAREHRRGTLAVHVVIAVHQDRPFFTDGVHQQLERDIHIGPAVRVGQALEVRAQERLGEIRRSQSALYENGRECVRDAQLRRQRACRVRICMSRDYPAGRDHSLAYNNTPQASQPSMVAPRWISAFRCVGTAVKQLPHELPCNG